jgi:alpha-glucosidase
MTEWGRGAVIYQIYPRSFRDTDGDGVGDLPGIIEKLDYVAALGVDGIWLSPFFTSPMKDFGYDVADYRGVDPLFGTMADFDALIARAHALGLKVMIDQVYSHSSDRHPWFAESRASRDNPKADWYVWADAKRDGSPPNNWQALFGGPSWEWDSRRRQYYLHNFLIEQPDLNVRNPAVQDALLAVARFWLARGVDGFRLDVVNFYVQDEQLRDNPARDWKRTPARSWQFQKHIHDRSQPETLAFIARLRAVLDEFGASSVGEIGDEDPLARQIEYASGPHRLHTAYSFFLLDARAATPALFNDALEPWRGAPAWPSWSLSNHDVPRVATRFAHDDPRRARLYMAVLLCLRGTIFLYQGEELGLPQSDVPFEKLQDPEAIRFWPESIGRDGARTPMPWTADGGFSSNPAPWLPMDARHLPLNAQAQANDPGSMWAFTRALIALRKAHPALRLGEWTPITATDAALAFLRHDENERLLCAFNFSDSEIAFDEPRLARASLLDCGLSASLSGARLTMPAFGGAIALLA